MKTGMMNRIIITGYFVSLICVGATNIVFAQTEIRTMTDNDVFIIKSSSNYVYGIGWDETNKDKALDLALKDLEKNLENKNQLKYYKVGRLVDEGFHIMVYIDIAEINNAKPTENNNERGKNISSTNAVPLEIVDLTNTRQYQQFLNKFQALNRLNKIWGSVNKGEMTNINNCYVAIFKGNDMIFFLDRGNISRKDLISGNIISNFETEYKNSNFKIIWIELIVR